MCKGKQILLLTPGWVDEAMGELAANQFDRILYIGPPAAAPKLDLLEIIPLGSLARDFQLFDEWATSLADALRENGLPLSVRSREKYRIALMCQLQEKLGGFWTAIRDMVNGLPDHNCSFVFGVAEPLLRFALENLFLKTGSPYRALQKGTHRANRMQRLGRTLAKAATLFSPSSLWHHRQILSDSQPAAGKRVLAYVNHSDDFEFFDLTLRILVDRGWDVLLVDIRRWKSELLPLPTDFPMVKLWTIESLASQFQPAPETDLRFDTAAIGDLPVSHPEAIASLTATLAEAQQFFSLFAAVNRRLWKRTRPAAILMMSEGPDIACAADAAAAEKIATIDLAHAIQPPHSRSYPFDALALFGPKNVASHLRREPPPASCEVLALGACRYDKLFHGEFPDAASVRRQLQLGEDQRVICFTSQYLWNNDARVRDAKTKLAAWIADALPPDCVFILKKHPLESDTICEDILAARLDPARYRVSRNENVYGILNISSVVLVMWSNTGLEAVLLDKPLIAIECAAPIIMPYIEYSVCRLVDSQHSLANALASALHSGNNFVEHYESNRARMIADILTSFDGNTSQRLADIVERKAQVFANTLAAAEFAGS